MSDGSSGVVETTGEQDDADGVSASGAADEGMGSGSEAVDSSTGEAEPDPCEPFLAEHQDPAQPCGLTEVWFEWRSAELTFAAQCQLGAAAPCIAERSELVFLEAHASADEGNDAPPGQEEEWALNLSDERGEAIEQYLVDLDVSGERLQVVSKGSLESQPVDTEEDRRVLLSWDGQ